MDADGLEAPPRVGSVAPGFVDPDGPPADAPVGIPAPGSAMPPLGASKEVLPEMKGDALPAAVVDAPGTMLMLYSFLR
jgi:hypothetical protein